METGHDVTRSRVKGWLGWPGLFAALLALAVAVGGPWIAEILDPPAPSTDEVAAVIAARIKERIKSKLRGEIDRPRPRESFRWSRRLPGFAIGMGVLGVSMGVLGLVRREDSRLTGSAIAVGAGAIVFQYALLLAGAILLLLLIGLILAAFGGGG